MKIKETANGWNIEPSTPSEESMLRLVLDALTLAYGRPCATKEDVVQASHLRSWDHNQHTVALG